MTEYAARDPRDLDQYYLRHVSAMTAEGLHEKHHIAAELAHRDREIDRLTGELERTRAVVAELREDTCDFCNMFERQQCATQKQDLRARLALLEALLGPRPVMIRGQLGELPALKPGRVERMREPGEGEGGQP